jgi:hypothetical protein
LGHPPPAQAQAISALQALFVAVGVKEVFLDAPQAEHIQAQAEAMAVKVDIALLWQVAAVRLDILVTVATGTIVAV